MGLEGKSVEAEDLAEAESDGGRDVFLLACLVVSSGSGNLFGSSGQDGGVEGRLTGGERAVYIVARGVDSPCINCLISSL